MTVSTERNPSAFRPIRIWLQLVIFALLPSHAVADSGTAATSRFMVSAAHPLAVDAGLKALSQGGTAVDAAVAVQTVLGLVEPQSSGIGGGAFMLAFNASTGELTTYDGRETAPMRVDSDLFLTPVGEPLNFLDAVVGGRSVGTPGTVALLARAHADHGRLPWPDLFQDAIELAEQGFPVGKRLASMVSGRLGERLKTFAETRNYFFPNGKPIQAGQVILNPEYAETLSTIAKYGSKAFYHGQIARTIVKTVQTAQDREGQLELADLRAYQVIERPPVCHWYRSYRVCGMGPPSSGAIAVGQILGILENFDLKVLGADSPLSWHLIAEASKLAFADRNQYAADSDFVLVPVDGLLNPDYLRSRSELIAIDSTIATPVQHGTPPGSSEEQQVSDASSGRSGTSHFSIIDEYGNSVSMTTTIEGPFGSQLMANGFLLNNELTDFSFVPERDGELVANRVEPGKRPRSSMSPTIVFDSEGSIRLVIGSPGGSRIIGYVVKTLVAVLDWDMSVQSAISLGNVVNRNGATELDIETELVWQLRDELSTLGHQLRIGNLVSGLHGIEVVNGELRGGADHRREGVARGY